MNIKEFKYMSRTTPKQILALDKNEIFVFGSNQAGRHGKGAAKTAMKWGAIYGRAEGTQGQTYGIPTKDKRIRRTLRLDEIRPYVNRFIKYTIDNPHLIFLVTPVGCGLAGLKPKQVAPLFKDAINIENIWLPKSFWRKLTCPTK